MLYLALFVCLGVQASLAVPAPAKVQAADEFVLTSSHAAAAIKYTSNITIRCSATPKGKSQFDTVTNMLVEKQVSETKWNVVAMFSGNQLTKKFPGISAAADITDDIAGSFLEITWPSATKDTIGVYRCDVWGLNGDSAPIMERTSPLEIKERFLSASDVFSMLNQFKRKTAQDIGDINEDITDLTDKAADAESNITALEGRLDKAEGKLENTEKDVQSLEDDFYSEWPQGSYSLLQTNSGCPREPAFSYGKKFYYSINTESTSAVTPRTKMSDNIHLSTPVLRRYSNKNLLYLRFCPASIETRSKFWPSGSYCINGYTGKSCPIGLTAGSTVINEEKSSSIRRYSDGSSSAEYTLMTSSAHTNIAFCCSKSGSAKDGIHLPKTSPFYLYRVGGTCQKVLGMSVRQEYLSIDTEDTMGLGIKSGTTPDIDFVNDGIGFTRIILCYYS